MTNPEPAENGVADVQPVEQPDASTVVQPDVPEIAEVEPADNGNSEAAKHRHAAKAARERAEAAETALTAANERVASMQRNEVTRSLTGTLADPTDLFRDGVELADLLGEDGHVDPEKVNAAAAATIAAHPHWAPRDARVPMAASTAGVGSTPVSREPGKTVGWADVIQKGANGE
jgi:hypothetical protein